MLTNDFIHEMIINWANNIFSKKRIYQSNYSDQITNLEVKVQVVVSDVILLFSILFFFFSFLIIHTRYISLETYPGDDFKRIRVVIKKEKRM